MKKIIYSDSQPELTNKVASQITLIETDKNIKSASESKITRELLGDLKPDKDHFMCHLIAVGDYETYGQNRNGDAWPKSACEKYTQTFVDNGYFYREHKNRGEKDSIGSIKAACYNEEMGRIELVVWGDKKKAEPEWDLIKAGEALSFSMSASVPNDRSSLDGTLHKTTAEYDDNLKYRMNQYIPEMKKYAFVYNDHPNWFDISKVAKPADRIAHFLAYDQGDGLEKCASISHTLNSSEMAEREGILIPDGSNLAKGCKSAAHQELLEKFATMEEKLHKYLEDPEAFGSGEFANYIKHAALNSSTAEDQFSDEQIAKLQGVNPGDLFYEMAKRAQVMPFESFVAYATDRSREDVTNCDIYKYAASALLPTVFNDLKESSYSELEDVFSVHNSKEACDTTDSEIDDILSEADEKFSVEEKPSKKRIMRISITRVMPAKPTQIMIIKKKACEAIGLSNDDLTQAHKLVQSYAFHKIATANRINDIHGHNYVDEQKQIILTIQNLIN